jgi:hypothetical protein
MRRGFLLGLALFLPAAARADEVYTRSGGHLTGEIVERGPQLLVVDIGIGRVELPLSYVDRIVPGDAPITVYRERARALAPGDLDGWLALGRWAGENELPSQAAEAFEHVVARDPGHAAAQRALGRVQLDGVWMTREESYEARGLVRFEGRWVPPAERQAALAERAEVARRAREEADEQARVRETEARLRAAEAEARIAEAQARVQEAEARAAEIQAAAFPVPIVPGLSYVPSYAVLAPVFAGVAGPRCHRSPGVSGGVGRTIRRAAGRAWPGRVTPFGRPVRGPSRSPGCNR